MKNRYQARSEGSASDGVIRVRLYSADRLLCFAEVIDLWQGDDEFCQCFVSVLAGAPFEAFFWETPPQTRRTLDRPFEFVLVESSRLARVRANPAPFMEYFSSDRDVVDFASLGRDAWLVVPCPDNREAEYSHLAQFSRQAAKDRQFSFWRHVGACVAQRIGDKPLWLSTSGLGVCWLHVRLDSRPKYYTFEAYRTFSESGCVPQQSDR